MHMKNAVAAGHRAWRRCAAAVRSLSPVAVIALTLAVVAGGAGIAQAATGGTFILGRSNSETSKATLSNSRGIPLALSAPRNTPPLAVNRSSMVKNLNAQFVGGLSGATLKATGGDGFTRPNANIALNSDTFTTVAKTGKLPAGNYYVSASALVDLTTGDSTANCVIFRTGAGGDGSFQQGSQSGGPFADVSETLAMAIHKGEQISEACAVTGSMAGSEATDAGIMAIRILSSTGTKPVRNAGIAAPVQPAARPDPPAAGR